MDNSSGNMMLAPKDIDAEAGLLIYNAATDSELMVTDSGIQNSPFHDGNGYFETLCEGGHCKCDGSMNHNSTFPWQVAVAAHNLVPSENSNLDAAAALAQFMRAAEPLLEDDVHCAWKSETEEGHSVW